MSNREYQKSSIVSCRPDYETATHWGQHYIGITTTFARDLGVKVFDLYKNYCNKTDFNSRVRVSSFLFGVGHGNQLVFTGQNGEILINAMSGADRKLVKGKHGSFLSCRFGQASILLGMKSFNGYTVDFTFTTSTFPNGYAALFFDPHSTYDEVICEGGSCRDAWLESDYVWRCNLAESNNYPEYVQRYLLADYEGRNFWGDWDSQPLFDSVEPPEPNGNGKPWFCKLPLPGFIKRWLGCD